jgi:hypothetical protein
MAPNYSWFNEPALIIRTDVTLVSRKFTDLKPEPQMTQHSLMCFRVWLMGKIRGYREKPLGREVTRKLQDMQEGALQIDWQTVL